MNTNRTHANRPSALTVADRARLSRVPTFTAHAAPMLYGARARYWIVLAFSLVAAVA